MIAVVSRPNGGLYRDKIYEITGYQKCSCGAEIVSYGVKHNVPLNRGFLDCHKCGKEFTPTDEWFVCKTFFAEIGREVNEAVAELVEETLMPVEI